MRTRKTLKQDWTIGSTVRVGFLTLKVVGFELSRDYGHADGYRLENAKGDAQYVFTPHRGLVKDTQYRGAK